MATTFTRMDESTAEQWAVIGKETFEHQDRVADSVLGMLRSLSAVTDGFFDVMQMPIVAGRGFAPEDAALDWKPLVIDRGQVIPLGKVQREHVHASLSQPVNRGVFPQILEGKDQHRMPGIDPGGRTVGSQCEGRDDDRHEQDGDSRRQHAAPAQPAGKRSDRVPLDRVTELGTGLPAVGGILLERPHDRAG